VADYHGCCPQRLTRQWHCCCDKSTGIDCVCFPAHVPHAHDTSQPTLTS
jgi:hypothetical protein